MLQIIRGKLVIFLITLCLFVVYLGGNDSNLLIVFYVQIMPDDFVMQLHRF
ncbi:Permease, cytosine/purine, uracil, thiamine, allantoin family [Escherichia coli]|nr:Permease, cytosine/purine, uracil, thiamine, allantoin family [Escherichia coli]